MDGKTLRISSAHYSQAIELSSGNVVLVRVDGGPHRWCEDMEDAKAKAQWVGEAAPWNASNPGKSDDGWDNSVSFRGDALATIKERSRVLYDVAEANEEAAAERVAASAAKDAENGPSRGRGRQEKTGSAPPRSSSTT